MSEQIIASILGGLVGGLFTFLGVLMTIAYEKKQICKRRAPTFKRKRRRTNKSSAAFRNTEVFWF